ncbi:MAG: polysaccharide deacetylase family protein, partial [Clostridia bacterium]|nr:polysaccharide deacetylase family protein [Clostridia bacterium]
MWNGKMKALTLSYDDGVEQDIRLISLMDKYGIKGTFNLNPGRQNYSDTFQKHAVTVHHLDLKDLPKVYEGHEVAGHSCTHPHLENLTGERLRDEVIGCQDQLSQLFGRKMYGFAYPYGTYNDEVIAVEKEAGICYSRTCAQHCR